MLIVLCIPVGLGAINAGNEQVRVSRISGADVFGGSGDKFVCKNLCTQTASPDACTPSEPSVGCDQTTNGQVCGEQISTVYTVDGCVKQDAGPKDPCVNGQAEAKCYKAKSCKCKYIANNNTFICGAVGTGSDRGSANGSDDCAAPAAP